MRRRVESQSGGTNGNYFSYMKKVPQCPTLLFISHVCGPQGKVIHQEPQMMYLSNHSNELIKSALKIAHTLAYNSNYIEKRLHRRRVNKNEKVNFGRKTICFCAWTVQAQMSARKTDGRGMAVDWTKVNLLVLILHCSYVRCQHWSNWVKGTRISLYYFCNFLWIYNYHPHTKKIF